MKTSPKKVSTHRVGKGRRLELVRQRGRRNRITLRFASDAEHKLVIAAAKRAQESMSRFVIIAALERAKAPMPKPVAMPVAAAG